MSQCKMILRHLKRGLSITPVVAFHTYGSLALHSRISELRSRGHKIDCKIVVRGSRRYGSYRLCK